MLRPRFRSGSPAKTPAQLSSRLNKGLVSYVAAASAVGAGILAMASPANAEVIYTYTNTGIYVDDGPVNLDLDRDGKIDFIFSNQSFSASSIGDAFLRVQPGQAGNAVWTVGVHDHKWQLAAPVFWGVVVGPGRKFDAGNAYLDFCVRNWKSGVSDTSFGLWGKGKHFAGPYLGLKFTIGGETHYGWARLTVQAKGISITARLIDYAYETVPNRPIITGMRHGTLDDAEIQMEPSAFSTPQTQPGSLGRLALGAAARPVHQ